MADEVVPNSLAQRLEEAERRCAELEAEQTELLDELRLAEASAAAARALAGELQSRLDDFRPTGRPTGRFVLREMRWAQPLRPIYRSMKQRGRPRT